VEAKIAQDERARELLLEQLNQLQMRLIRNRKVKEKKDLEAAEKLRCLEQEMEEAGEDTSRVVQDPLATEEGLAAWGIQSPMHWFDDTFGVPVPNMPVSRVTSVAPDTSGSVLGS